MLKKIFIKTVEQRILSLFADSPGSQFYGREVSKKLNISLGAVSGALRSLEKNGVLICERKGKTGLYVLKLPNPCFNYFRILNSILTMEPLIEKIKSISGRIVLYGSYSTGDFTSDSDLDLFIVSRKKEEALEIIEKFNKKTGFKISPIIKEQAEWMRMEKAHPEFFAQLSRGIVLWERQINESGF